jgi:hypothetical protein
MHSFMDRIPARLSSLAPAVVRSAVDHQHVLAVAPLAGLGARESAPDPVFMLSGMAVLSAGLVVLRAAHGVQRTVTRVRLVAAPEQRRVYTAEEALAEREFRAGDREVLISALAAAAETFYSIAGHLPREASDRALGKADDLRELVWMNRSR